MGQSTALVTSTAKAVDQVATVIFHLVERMIIEATRHRRQMAETRIATAMTTAQAVVAVVVVGAVATKRPKLHL